MNHIMGCFVVALGIVLLIVWIKAHPLMNANQLASEILSWVKRISAICLTLVVAAIIVEAAAKLFGIRIPVHGPDWSQNNALMLAALAYATGRT